MKPKKILRFFLIILILILLFTIIRSTYSKYVTSYDKSTGATLLAWNIKVNDEKITTDANFTNTLNVVFDNSDHIATGTIAPTRTGTVDLTLDSTGTQVPYEYEIKIVDGDVDYESSYVNELVDSWETNGTYTYQMNLNIDYSHLKEPIFYECNYTREPWYESVFNPVEVSFTMPPGFSLKDSQIYGIDPSTITINGNTVTFTPLRWQWQTSTEGSYVDPDDPTKTIYNYSNNKLTLQFHLNYDGVVDVETEDFWAALSLGGKKILKSNLPDYRIYAYSLNGGEKVTLDETITSITGIVQPADNINTVVKNDVKLYVEWYDGPGEIMDNAEDVAVTKIDNPYGTVPIGVFVTQVTD